MGIYFCSGVSRVLQKTTCFGDGSRKIPGEIRKGSGKISLVVLLQKTTCSPLNEW